MSKNKCGIYKIHNLENNKIYIGQSRNITQRIYAHTKKLKEKTHENKHLQNSYNKYGEDNFIFEIIEECEEEILNEREIYYISKFKSYESKFGYNKTLGGYEYTLTEEAREDLIKRSNILYGQPIYQIDLKGNIINEWPSARKAARDLNINQSCILECLQCNRKTYKTYIWIYKKELSNFNYLNYINLKGQKNKILQFSMDNNTLTKEWESAYEAGKHGFDQSAIIACCRGKYKSHKGFIWRYADLQNKTIEVKKSNNYSKPIIQLDLNGNYIEEWPSMFQASKSLNVNNTNIHKCVNGKQNQTGGFKWIYKENYENKRETNNGQK